MVYLYNYNFIKYLNSVWSFLFLLFFINIALLFLTSTCLADGEINPNLNSEDKKLIKSLPKDNIVRRTCEETGISFSDAIFQNQTQIKVAERLQTEANSLSLLDEIRSWKPEDSNQSVVITNDQLGLDKDPKQYNKSFDLEDLPIPAKFFLGVTAFGLGGGSVSQNFASYSMHPPLKGGIAACKLPFILKPIPVPIMGRIGATVGASIFIGGVCTGCIDLESFDCSGAVSLLQK